MSLCFLSLPLLNLSTPLYRKNPWKRNLQFVSFHSLLNSLVSTPMCFFTSTPKLFLARLPANLMLNPGQFSHWCYLIYQHIRQGLSLPPSLTLSLRMTPGTPHSGIPSCIRAASMLLCQLLPTPWLLMLEDLGLSIWTHLLPLPISLPLLTLLSFIIV